MKLNPDLVRRLQTLDDAAWAVESDDDTLRYFAEQLRSVRSEIKSLLARQRQLELAQQQRIA